MAWKRLGMLVAGFLLLTTSSMGWSVMDVQAKALPRPQLAGRTVLTGRSTGYIPVKVSHPTVLQQPLADPSRVTISGRGRFVGFALIREVPGFKGLNLIGGRFTEAIPPLVMSTDLQESEADGFEILPGNYRLYLITDGSSATVTLRFGGLRGTVRLSPRRPARAVISDPASATEISGRRETFVGGDTTTLRGRGLQFDALWNTQDVHAHTEYWICYYEGMPQGPSPYAPGCPSTSGRGDMYTSGENEVATYPTGSIFPGIWGPLPPGTYSVGGSFVATHPVTDGGFTSVWLTYG